LSYSEIKKLVYNSIRYSFLDEKSKGEILKRIDKEFEEFEREIEERIQ